MAEFSNYLENKVLDHVLRNVSYAKLINLIKKSQAINQEFVALYKQKIIDVPKNDIYQEQSSLDKFLI